MSNKSSRRDFVKRSAAVAAGVFVIPEIIPSSALGMGGRTSSKRPYCYGCNWYRIAGNVQYERFSGA